MRQHASTIEPPTVTDVMATYNRSNLLAMVVRTVQWQTFPSWELLIVGDACTDDTQAVVESFDEPRIRFHNLARNSGGQSEPNNEGMRLARGRYIAFLNHDDFWWPDHLEASLRSLQETEADLVYSAALSIVASDHFVVEDNLPRNRDSSRCVAPASCWLFKRDLVDALGPWLHQTECYGAASQEWLHRARCAGRRVQPHPTLSVVRVPSGLRDNAYARRLRDEHEVVYRDLTADPVAYRSRANRMSRHRLRGVWGSTTAARRLAMSVVYTCFEGLQKLGVASREPAFAYVESLVRLTWPRKGSFAQTLRERRGLAS